MFEGGIPLAIITLGSGTNLSAPTILMQKQVQVYYTGRVQGVGFRFTVIDTARAMNVTGWVKNLNDGRVELLAEAEEDTLKVFLEKINSYFSRYIQGVDSKWSYATGAFRDFGIEY